MKHLFTPAAQRAIEQAAGWRANGPAAGETVSVGAAQLLLGLLEENECRAARMLAERGVDREKVVRRLGPFDRAEPPGDAPAAELSLEMEHALRLAEARLSHFPDPLTLATEHLLLGILCAEDEAGRWLGEQGFDADALESEIHQLYGHDPEPLPLEMPETAGSKASPSQRESEQGAAFVEGTAPEASPTPPAGPPALPRQPVQQRTAMLRILDAAANRAREGLRVVEDYARFALDDAHLTGQLKEVRHALAELLARFDRSDALASRETLRDVGTGITTGGEQSRPGPAEVLAANCKRVEEALRSLEEYGKVLDPEAAAGFERLRYRMYTLERAFDVTRRSAERLAGVRLYVLLDGRSSEDEFARLVEDLVAAGVDALQLRDKRLEDGVLVERARLLRRLTQGGPTLSIINDRPDVAVLCRVDGVHVGQEELGVKDVRSIVGPGMLIGRSTHSIEQARAAVLDGADYIGVGPTFPSQTKSFEAFPGLDLLRAVAAEISLPAFAIGGIGAGNVADVLRTGMTRVAVGSAITQDAEPAARARELKAVLTG